MRRRVLEPQCEADPLTFTRLRAAGEPPEPRVPTF